MRLPDGLNGDSALASRRAFLAWSTGVMASFCGLSVFGGSMDKGSTTVILGGGFGGIATARNLRKALPPEHRILLVSRTSSFQMGTTKTWVMLGEAEPEKVTRPLDVLSSHGIEVLLAEVQRIEPSKMEITTSDGVLRPDYVVIALGAELDMAAVPGLAEAGETFYTRDGAVRLRSILQDFAGGKIVLVIPRIPFQCPPGPYEAAMMLRSYLRARGLAQKSSIEIHTVEKSPMATAGPAIGKYITDSLGERGIGFHPQCQVQSVDGAGRAVVLADGTRISYDLLIAIPPHAGPRVVRESGLTNAAGWVPADPKTLEMTDTPRANRIFAIGDVTSVPLPGRFNPDMPLVLPKAGIFAERQASVVASRIASHVLDREVGTVFDGKGFCYIEVGDGQAMRGDGSFFDMPHPTMTPRSPDGVQLAEKKAWVDSWMSTYL